MTKNAIRVLSGVCAGIALALTMTATTDAYELAVGGQPQTARMKKGCGWTGCYLKFNKTETNRIAAGAGVATLRIPPPWDLATGLTAAYAGYVSSQGQCVMLSYSPLVSMTRIQLGSYRCR